MSTKTKSPVRCYYCFSDKIVNYGVKRGVKIADLPSGGKANHIIIDRRRYLCKECGKNFLEKLQGVDEKRNLSLRLIAYIKQQSLHRSFLSIAKDVGLNEGTIRNIFKEFLSGLEESFSPITPTILSFNEIIVASNPRYLVGNFELHTIVGILPDIRSTTIGKYLEQLPDKENVTAVVMDMNTDCRKMVNKYLPTAKIVVNPTDIDNTLLCILEKLRQKTREGLPSKELRQLAHDREIIQKHLEELTEEDKKRLTSWEKLFKKLVFAYWRKEELRIILKEGNREEAMTQYLIWQNDVLADSIKEYFPIIDEILDWQKEVFGWMELKVTDRDTYYQNVIDLRAALQNKLDRGSSFEAVKARILQQQSTTSNKGIKFNKVIWRIVAGQHN